MTSDGLGEMYEGDFVDMCGKKFQLMTMGELNPRKSHTFALVLRMFEIGTPTFCM